MLYGGRERLLFFFSFFFKGSKPYMFVMERTPTYIMKWKKKKKQDADYIQLKKTQTI